MAPRQNTFTLVPNPLGMQGLVSRPAAASGPQSKPPMTSKQAQKLYKQATRQPRMSKAEQRRLEREEQERIRRELEKGKHAAKARLLREKKKAKEQQALEEKRRKGLPLVDVRPSQDTIARFVRGNGLRRKRDSADAMARLPAVDEEAEEDDGSATRAASQENGGRISEQAASMTQSKRRRLSQHTLQEGNNDDRRGTRSKGVVVAVGAAQLESQGYLEPRLRQRNSAADSKAMEQEATITSTTGASPTAGAGKPAVLEQEKEARVVLDRGAAETPMRPLSQRDPTAPETHDHRDLASKLSTSAEHTGSPILDAAVREQSAQQQPAALEKRQTPGTPQPAEPSPIRLPERQPSPKLLPAQHSAARKPLQELINSSNRVQQVPAVCNASKFASPYRAAPASARGWQASPTVPAFKQARPEPSAARVQRPRYLPAHLRSQATRSPLPGPASANRQQTRHAQGNSIPAPPTSTQLFIMSHIDEILPTPSQEARELQQDSPIPQSKEPEAGSRRSTATASAGKPAFHSRNWTRPVSHSNRLMAPPRRPRIPGAVEPPVIPFISTQDLILSSQDLRDLDETMTTPSTTEDKADRSMPSRLEAHHDCVQRQQEPQSGCLEATRRTISPAACIEPAKSHPPAATTSKGNLQSPLLPQSSARWFAQRTTSTPQKDHPTLAAKHRTPNGQMMTTHQALACDPKRNPGPRNSHTPQADMPGTGAGSVVLPGRACMTAEVAAPLASPEKPRFFGSNGLDDEYLLAVDQSRQTHEEEERRRRAEYQIQQAPDGNIAEVSEQEQRQQKSNRRDQQLEPAPMTALVLAKPCSKALPGDDGPRKCVQQGNLTEARFQQHGFTRHSSSPGRAPCSGTRGGHGRGPPAQQERPPLQKDSNKAETASRHGPAARGQPEETSAPTMSQETDYGDLEPDVIDLLDLRLDCQT
ncbi:hypothetical protein VTK56DRAFT_5535 [Thermocarpiscus australiensis]